MSTPPPPEPEDVIAQADVARRRGISIVWLVPLIALSVGAWLVYKAYTEKGPTITIYFKEANGVTIDKTMVRYRDVDVGKVTGVSISDDLKGVDVTADLDKNAAPLLGEKARFWVAQPQISVTGVRDLQTLLSGAYIGIDPDTGGKTARTFNGLSAQPFVSGDRDGRIFILRSDYRDSLNRGAPVLHRGFKVGEIIDYVLVEDDTKVDVRVFIEAPHYELITDRTQFWDVSGIDVELSADGIKLKTKSFASLLIGGVTFGEPTGGEPGKPAADGARLTLHANEAEAFRPQYTKQRYLVHFNESVRGLTIGAPVEFRGAKMGEVVDIRAQFRANDLTFRIPVYVDIEPERFEIIGELAANEVERARNFHVLVDRGLRAQLKTGSLVTGQKLVELDIYPDAKPVEIAYEDDILVIPTIPTVLDTVTEKVTGILDKIERLPLDAIGENLSATISRARHLVEEAEIQTAIDSLTATLKESETLVKRLNDDVVPPLTSTLQQSSTLSKDLNADLAPQLSDVLREFKDAARAIRVLSDYLEQHPDALIKGKK